MSSNLETDAKTNKVSVLATIEHAGNLIEHISCDNSTVLSEHIKRCNREGRRVVPGNPQSLPEKTAQRISYFLSLDGADKIIEHCRPDQVISVEAGITIAALQKLLSEHKQWFPVCLADDRLSLMEYINRGSSGPLEHGYGEARDLVLGMQVVLGSGELIKCGGKVVKNVTGYDLPKLFAGSHGTLCIPYSAHLRLFALPETSSTIVIRFKKIEQAFDSARKLCRSGLPLSCLEIADSNIFKTVKDDSGLKAPAHEEGEILLCVQIHGIGSVVAELEKELHKISERDSQAQEKLDAEQEKQLWKLLAQPTQFIHANWIEMAGSTRVIEQLITEIKSKNEAFGQLVWTARPGRNKAILLLPRPITAAENYGKVQSDLIAFLKDSVASTNSTITIACADSQYLWSVQRLPESDQVLEELKRRLKHEFDPQAVLNPLALI